MCSLRGELYLPYDSDEKNNNLEGIYDEQPNPYPQSYQVEGMQSAKIASSSGLSSNLHIKNNLSGQGLPEYAVFCFFVSVLCCAWASSEFFNPPQSIHLLFPSLVSTSICSGFLMLNMLHWHHQSFLSSVDEQREKRVNICLRAFLLISQIGAALAYTRIAFQELVVFEIGQDDVIEATYTRVDWSGLLFLVPAIIWLTIGLRGWELTGHDFMSNSSTP